MFINALAVSPLVHADHHIPSFGRFLFIFDETFLMRLFLMRLFFDETIFLMRL